MQLCTLCMMQASCRFLLHCEFDLAIHSDIFKHYTKRMAFLDMCKWPMQLISGGLHPQHSPQTDWTWSSALCIMSQNVGLSYWKYLQINLEIAYTQVMTMQFLPLNKNVLNLFLHLIRRLFQWKALTINIRLFV